MIIIYILLVIIILISIITIIYITNYKKLSNYNNKINQSLTIINESLINEYNTLIKIKEIIINNIKDTKINFKDLDNININEIKDFDLEESINNTIDLIKKIKDDYKDIEDIKEYRILEKELKSYNEKLTAAQNYYNNYVGKLNEEIKKFPSNIISKLRHIEERNLFKNKNLTKNTIDF
jgi:hypothetical protein